MNPIVADARPGGGGAGPHPGGGSGTGPGGGAGTGPTPTHPPSNPPPTAPTKFLALLLVAALLAGCAPKPEAVEVPGPPVPVLPACTTEDDVSDCLWDAQEQGNGKGRSFIRYRNRTFVEVK